MFFLENADALSRIPCNSCQNQQRQSETTEEDGEVQVMDECKPNQIRAITRSILDPIPV
jgi:hypothetical protein